MGQNKNEAVVHTGLPIELIEKYLQEKFPTTQSQSVDDEMIDWWFGSVFFSVFPILIAFLISFLRNGYFDVHRILGDGELILASFSVVTPAIFMLFSTRAKMKQSKKLFYSLITASFLQLVTYVSIKTNSSNIPWIVYSTSGLSLLSSVFIAYLAQKRVRGE